MRNLILCILLSLFSVGITQADGKNVTGEAQVRDGDSLFVDGENLRLDGVDAPELEQTCSQKGKKKFYPGNEAKAWLESYINGKKVSCAYTGKGRFGRALMTCFLDGENLNQLLATKGYAAVNPAYNTQYQQFAKEAKKQKIGMWAGKCQMPWVWRKEQRAKAKKKN